MTERISEKKFVNQIFGRNETPNNLARKAAATIYHSIFLHNPPKDAELLAGIRKNLAKLITREEIKMIEDAHAKDGHDLK